MGLSLLLYVVLAATGIWMFGARQKWFSRINWLRSLHTVAGGSMVGLVLLLLVVGLVGTIGHYGSLGHSSHLAAGLTVVGLVLLSAGSAIQIAAKRSWARPLHVTTNVILLVGFVWVLLTGWSVVQKYLP